MVNDEPGRRWWARRFVAALEAGAEAGRLRRGRSYADSGAVESLTVRPGEVLATVHGSRARPYRVSLILPELDHDQWETVTAALAGQPLFRGRLLSGDLPPEVERVFDILGVPLFPRGLDGLALNCSCPDWGSPCKHVAAALLVLADRLDADPFLLLAWLGRPRGELLSGLRRHARTAGGGEVEGAEDAGEAFADHPRPALPTPPPLPDDPDAFWACPTPPHPPDTPPEPAILAADPPDGTDSLAHALRPLYDRLTR